MTQADLNWTHLLLALVLVGLAGVILNSTGLLSWQLYIVILVLGFLASHPEQTSALFAAAAKALGPIGG